LSPCGATTLLPPAALCGQVLVSSRMSLSSGLGLKM
jgi:hypothetical protein